MKTCVHLNRDKKAGFSLIEVMIAMLLLAILVIGTVAIATHSGETIAVQGIRREAIAAAHRRMEEVRSELYTHFLTVKVNNINIGDEWIYLSYADTTFLRSKDDPEETVVVHGASRAIRTRVRFVAAAEGNYATAQCLEIDVTVETGAGGDVVLRSFYAN